MSLDDHAPDDTPPALEVVGVDKSFGENHVLRDVHLIVPAGGLAAVLGPSGCGKTTLLRVVAGFLAPDAGVVRVGGRAVAGTGTWLPPERRRVGIVPQEGALFPHLRVGENVAFGIVKGPDRPARVAYWLGIVGLAGAERARPHELSGGQQQRVALARALAADPALVLLDEPFSSLDAGLRVQVREEITRVLRDAGRSAVLVTHDQQEALSTADVVVVLLDGAVAQVAAPEELYRRPVSLAVATFVGDTVLLDGAVRAGFAEGPLGRHEVVGRVADGPATLVLRPEQIVLDGTAQPAEVVHRSFSGAEVALRVRLASGVEATCRTKGDDDASIGARVGVRVNGAVLAFPREALADR